MPSPPSPDSLVMQRNMPLEPQLAYGADFDRSFAPPSPAESAQRAASALSGAPASQFDELLFAVESKLAARSELLYKARTEAPPAEFISPRQAAVQQPRSFAEQYDHRRHVRQDPLHAALSGVLHRPVSESQLAGVALNFLNTSAPPTRGEMSQFLLRHQLASIHALVGGGAQDASHPPQQQQLHASAAHQASSFAPAGMPFAHASPQQQSAYCWEENLSLSS